MSFQKLSLDQLRPLRPILEKMLPTSAMMLNLVDVTLSQKLKDDDYVHIYGFMDGSPITEENLFINVILKPGHESDYTILHAPKVVTNEMLEAFIKLYDWTGPEKFEFGAIPEHFSQHLRRIFAEKGGTSSFNRATDMYLPIEDAMKLDLKREDLEAEFELDKLTYENGAKVNSHWRYGSPGGEVHIGHSITAFGGAGIFKKSTDGDATGRSNDNLVSWIVFLRLGTFNALHTLDEYRGRGLGSWTMEAGSKFIAQQGLIPLCEIEPYNKQSRRLVEKIGYKVVQEVDWIKYEPKKAQKENNCK